MTRTRAWILIVIVAFVVFSWLMAVTTPPECKVPVSQMSSMCKDLLYP